MFGKPAWFRKKSLGWGLRPVVWQGWLYSLAWTAVICGPFIALVAAAKIVEALIWIAVMMLALLWDVRQVLRQMEPRRRSASRDAVDAEVVEDVLFIDDKSIPDLTSQPAGRYDLHAGR